MNSALLTLYRSLTRHRLYAVLNIGGLALGIAVFLVLFLLVQFERGYDRVLPGADKIWVAQRTLQFPGTPRVPVPTRADMLAQVQADYPGTAGTRFASGEVAIQNGTAAIKERRAAVDTNFFALFPYPAIAGDPATALTSPDSAVITRRIARTYLGSGSPLGRTLTIVEKGVPHPYRVSALIEDLPANVSFNADIFVPLKGDSNAIFERGLSLTTFLRLPDPPIAATRLAQWPAFVARHPDPDISPETTKLLSNTLKPLASLHLTEPRDRAIVAVLGAIGLLALGVAIVNYVNLATARAGLRAREVALRKVLGGTRRSLILQFLFEAVASAAIAALVGLALAEMALPLINVTGGTTLGITYLGAGSIMPPVVLMILVTGLLAGLYPAFVLSRFQPAAVLASVRAPGGTRSGLRLRQALVVMQFGIAVALMIGTGVLVSQMRHLRSSDLGFQRGGLIMVSSFADEALDPAQRHDLLAAFARIPGVTAITRSAVAPSGGSFNIAPMHRAGAAGPAPMIIQSLIAPRFFETYRARLLAGRLFDAGRYAADGLSGEDIYSDKALTANIVINRTAMAALGFATPAAAIGQTITIEQKSSATIVGVIDDMRFKSPRDPVEPQAYFEVDRDLHRPVVALRYAGDDPRAVLAAMERAWRRIAATVPFEAKAVDQQLYETFYQQDAQRSRLFTIGALLAVLIGCIGLYGLASFDTACRVKEIGIRKTLGASTRDILKLLIGQFMRPVLLANLIAWPMAFFAMRSWLSGFDDRVALSPFFFIGASVLAIAIATLTVIGQAWRVAGAEPARALRYE